MARLLNGDYLAAAECSLERPPYLLETSLPDVFAVGDVRCGDITRVASAVGEGSIAISFVHRMLAESFATPGRVDSDASDETGDARSRKAGQRLRPTGRGA